MRPQTAVVFDGQSLNYYPLTGPTTYPYVAMSGRSEPWYVVGIIGWSWSDLAATAQYRCHPIAKAYARSILVMTGGTSDITPSSVTFGDDDTAAVALADFEAYADAARAAGFTKIIASTVTPSILLDADGETQRGLLNAGIRASSHWDAVVDLAAVASLTNNLDSTYYSDGSHFTAAGAALAAAAVEAVLTPML